MNDMTEREQRRLLRRNVRKRGEVAELIKTMEELGELTQAVAKLLGEDGVTADGVDRVAEEMADVEIMLAQVRVIIPTIARQEAAWIQRKLRRMRADLAAR